MQSHQFRWWICSRWCFSMVIDREAVHRKSASLFWSLIMNNATEKRDQQFQQSGSCWICGPIRCSCVILWTTLHRWRTAFGVQNRKSRLDGCRLSVTSESAGLYCLQLSATGGRCILSGRIVESQASQIDFDNDKEDLPDLLAFLLGPKELSCTLVWGHTSLCHTPTMKKEGCTRHW